MKDRCDKCKAVRQDLVAVGNAEVSAQYSGLVGVPYPYYEYLCPTCALEVLGISESELRSSSLAGAPISQTLVDIHVQKDLMIAVSTGGPRIQDKESEYRERRLSLASRLNELGIADPNPYADLWAWYGKWSSGDLPTYKSRRKYIADLYDPLIVQLERQLTSLVAEATVHPTGWSKVDRGVDAIRARLENARTEEEFQTVGLLCRETLISLAQAVYDPSIHRSPDDTQPSEADANRMLEAYFGSALQGRPNEAARRHARAALSLANELQHRRTAQFRDAALCAEATRSVVNIVAIVSGRRDPTSESGR